MRLAVVGCGYVADYYLQTLPSHPRLRVVGAYDHNPSRRDAFCRHHGLPAYGTLDRLLVGEQAEMVLNLTNPDSHYAVTHAALTAGKHVYSEKPLAMHVDEARELIDLARAHSLGLASAPCNVLGESAQTLWRELRQGRIGPVRLVYAEMDDGMIPRENYHEWFSRSGAPWPAKDEFEVGCTFEHAGYYLTWLAAFFGPVRRMTSHSACLLPMKRPAGRPLDRITPDFSVGFWSSTAASSPA